MNLQREQQLDTFRASAKPPPEIYQPSDELRGGSEDEMSRLKTDQLPLKRKAFSFAGFPVLAQQRFSSLRKQTQTAQNSLVTKENYESVNTSKRQFRRMDTSYLTSVSEDNSDTGREKKHSSLKMLSEEHNDWLVKNNYATICSGSRRDIKWCDTLVFSSIVSSRLARPLVSRTTTYNSLPIITQVRATHVTQ